MRRSKNLVFAVIIGAIGIMSAPGDGARAQVNQSTIQTFSGFRVGLFSGAFIPNAVDFSGAGVMNGIPISGTGRITSSPGPAVGGFIGYTPNEHFNIDLDIGNAWNNLDKLEGSLALGPLPPQQGKFNLNGNSTITGSFLNFTFLPLGTGTFSPYFGGGPGVTLLKTTINSINVGNTNLPINEHNSDARFAANILAGLDMRIGDRWEIGISYQFLWIDSGNLGSSSVLAGRTGHLTGQLVGALFEYHL